MSRGSRESLYRYQAHGLLDAVGRCSGAPDRRLAYDAELRELPCAVCLEWYELAVLEEDHAPQRKSQSNLGRPRVVVLTCKACNGGAGGTYEGIVKNEDDLLVQIPDPICRVHERYGRTRGGVVIPRSMAERQLVDLKTAYLVAFATLGYRWAASPRLDRLRSVLRGQTGLMFAGTEFDIICACSNVGIAANSVCQVTRPVPALLVTGAHASVLLPTHQSPANIAGTLQTWLGGGMYRLDGVIGWQTPWPHDYTTSRPVEQVWNDVHAGTLFHVGRCTDPWHHYGYVMSASELDIRLNPASHR